MRPYVLAIVLGLLGVAVPLTAAVECVSVTGAGVTGNCGSSECRLSADGRYAVFSAVSTDLVAGDTNGKQDVFVRDRQAGTTSLVSVGVGGAAANGHSASVDISADGRYVVFASEATNLVTGDANGQKDIFLRDLTAGTTELVSVTAAGGAGNGPSDGPRVSADGRYVAYCSWATNLVAGDTNGKADVFVRDRVAGTTERVSVATDGTQAAQNSGANGTALSGDGRYVAFWSAAGSNLVAGVATDNVYVRDRAAGTTQLVGVASDGTVVNGSCTHPAISADGRAVAFVTAAANVVAGDTDTHSDVFVRDLVAGTTERVSFLPAGVQAIADTGVDGVSLSGDGRYAAFTWLVVTSSGSAELIMVRDRDLGVTLQATPSADGSGGAAEYCQQPALSSDGAVLGFFTAAKLVTADTNSYDDAYVTANPAYGGPAAPTDLATTALATSTITLGWTDHSAFESGFKVERAVGTRGLFTQIGLVAANVTSYASGALAECTLYRYRVRAYSAAGNSAYTSVVSATTCPAAPTGLTGTPVGGRQVNLAWTDNSKGETGYRVERALAGHVESFFQLALLEAGATAYSDSTAVAGRSYAYRVCAYNASGDSAFARVVATPPLPPAAPTGLTATAPSGAEVDLAWTNGDTTETGFRVERAEGSGDFTALTTLAAGATSYVDLAVTAGTTYTYRVLAFNLGGDSAYSNTAGAMPPLPPAAPTGLTATALSSSRVRLNWTDNATDESGYLIRRGAGAATPTGYGEAVADTTTWTDTACARTTSYTYQVGASGPGGMSAWAAVTVTVPSFDDVLPASGQWAFVEAMYREGITSGCQQTPPLYCPNSPVTRGQMAVFLCRAAGWSPVNPATPTFTDVPATSPQYGFIEALKGHGVTSGCGGSKYCPDSPVTRGQMAVFLCRAAGIAQQTPVTATFTDVPKASAQWAFVEGLYAAKVTAGCVTTAPLAYCPEAAVTRGQMAVFLCRAFGISTR